MGRVIQSFLDGDVEESFADKIAEHLEDCRRCGLEAEIYEGIRDAMATRREDVDPAVITRLRAFGNRLTDASD